jgi:hypothetical protein
MLHVRQCFLYIHFSLASIVFHGVSLRVSFQIHLPNLCTNFDCGFFRVPGLTHRFWQRIVPFTQFTQFWHTEFDYRYLNWGSQRVWPVSRGCLLLRGTWSYLRICRRSVLPYTRFCNCLLITITFYTLLTSLFCILRHFDFAEFDTAICDC